MAPRTRAAAARLANQTQEQGCEAIATPESAAAPTTRTRATASKKSRVTKKKAPTKRSARTKPTARGKAAAMSAAVSTALSAPASAPTSPGVDAAAATPPPPSPSAATAVATTAPEPVDIQISVDEEHEQEPQEEASTPPLSANILATTQAQVPFRFSTIEGHIDGVLGGRLEVVLDREATSRLAYRAKFALAPASAEPRQGGQAGDEVAQIDSWRIDRQTRDKPATANRWVQQLLEPALRNLDGSDATHEAAMCLKAVFTRTGALKAAVKQAAARELLGDRSLIFVQMIEVTASRQKQGLLRPIMQMYRQMLQTLPEWFAFDGTVVLVPALPMGDAGRVWGDLPEEEVESTLRRIYENADGYVTCVRDAVVEGMAVTVMARSVADS